MPWSWVSSVSVFGPWLSFNARFIMAVTAKRPFLESLMAHTLPYLNMDQANMG